MNTLAFKLQQKAQEILGWSGAMISHSKSDYWTRYPNNVIVFNANVCVKSVGKIWHGDLDVTKSLSYLISLAQTVNEDVYILSEMDGRFDNEHTPIFEKFKAKFSPDGQVSY